MDTLINLKKLAFIEVSKMEKCLAAEKIFNSPPFKLFGFIIYPGSKDGWEINGKFYDKNNLPHKLICVDDEIYCRPKLYFYFSGSISNQTIYYKSDYLMFDVLDEIKRRKKSLIIKV